MSYYDHRVFLLDIKASKQSMRDALSQSPSPDLGGIAQLDREIAAIGEVYQLWQTAKTQAIATARLYNQGKEPPIPAEVQAEATAIETQEPPKPLPLTHSEFLKGRRAAIVRSFEGLLASPPNLRELKEYLTTELREVESLIACLRITGDRQLVQGPALAYPIVPTSNEIN